MGAGAAHVESGDRAAVVGIAEQRPRREQLPEVEGAMKNVAADQAEGALEVERGENLPRDQGASCADHEGPLVKGDLLYLSLNSWGDLLFDEERFSFPACTSPDRINNCRK